MTQAAARLLPGATAARSTADEMCNNRDAAGRRGGPSFMPGADPSGGTKRRYRGPQPWEAASVNILRTRTVRRHARALGGKRPRLRTFH